MASHSRDNSDRNSDISLPSIDRRLSGQVGGVTNCWDAPIAVPLGRRLGSPLIMQDRVTAADDWMNSQMGSRDLLFCPRPPMDPQDQLKMYKEELAKRDRLIAQLASVETPRPKAFDSSRIDEMYSTDRLTATVTAKSEAAILQVKVEGLQSQLRECQSQIDTRDDKIKELRLALETSKEGEAKQIAVVQSVRNKLVEYEAQLSHLEGVVARSDIAIKALQKENDEKQDRILELESYLRSSAEDRKKAEDNHTNADAKLFALTRQLSHLLADNENGVSSSDDIVDIVKSLNRDVTDLRGKLLMIEEYVRSLELEQKASRETILRLVAEAEKERHMASGSNMELQTLKTENDEMSTRNRDLDREIHHLKECLESNKSALSAARTEAEDCRDRNGKLNHEIRNRESMNQNAEQQLRDLRRNLASVLFSGQDAFEAGDEDIRDQIQNLLFIVKDKTARVDLLQEKISEMSEQLKASAERSHSAEHQLRRAAPDIRQMDERLQRAENEMAAGEILRDNLRSDKEKFLQFLEKLSNTLAMDPVTADMGIDGATVAILLRCEQIMKNESSAIVDRKTTIYGLQRQIKSLKEQLDSKELHMELLRKKLTSLEERISGKSELEREKDGEYVKNRKLVKLVDKYKCELNEAHVEIRDLKARLLRSSDIQTRMLESDKRIEQLELKIAQLEELRDRQASKIASLQNLVKGNVHQTSKKDEVSSNTIQALTSELRTTKQSLEETTKREHQLLELRQVISRMLGLDVNTLAIPDYELISRLEKLVVANQANAATAIVLDSAIADLGDGFRSGYHDAGRSLALATRSFHSPYRHLSGIRSASPQRNFEASTY